MKIINFDLKEKFVKLEGQNNLKSLAVEIKRNNFMPVKLEEEKLSCVIELNIVISNENKQKALEAKVAYFILATEIRDYSQNKTADELFEKLVYVFFEEISNLLKAVKFPPIPLAAIIKK